MVRNAVRTHEKRRWTANVARAIDRRRRQTNDQANNKSTQNPSKINPKSRKNRRQIALGPLGGGLERLGVLPERSGVRGCFGSAPGGSRDVLGRSQGYPRMLLRGCWVARGCYRDVREHPHGAFGCVFRGIWAQTLDFDNFCLICR